MRLKFWRWAHGAAEWVWHWIYYNHLRPLETKAGLWNGTYWFDRVGPQPTQGGWFYTYTYRNAMGNETTSDVPTDGKQE